MIAASPPIVKAKPKFRKLSESEVIAAVETQDPDNPIGAEAKRLCDAYAEIYFDDVLCERCDPRSPLFPTVEATCAIEAVARQVTADMIRVALAGLVTTEGTA